MDRYIEGFAFQLSSFFTMVEWYSARNIVDAVPICLSNSCSILHSRMNKTQDT